MKKLIPFIIMSFLVMFGCSNNPNVSGGPIGPAVNIDITGKWLTWNTGVPYMFTVNNTSVTYTNTGLNATIVSFDNTQKYCILYWNAHPAYFAKYQKESWTNLTAATFTAAIYTATNSAAAAQAQTIKLQTYPCSNRP